MRDFVLTMLGFCAGVFAVFTILACGSNAVWCLACAIISFVGGIIIGGEK